MATTTRLANVYFAAGQLQRMAAGVPVCAALRRIATWKSANYSYGRTNVTGEDYVDYLVLVSQAAEQLKKMAPEGLAVETWGYESQYMKDLVKRGSEVIQLLYDSHILSMGEPDVVVNFLQVSTSFVALQEVWKHQQEGTVPDRGLLDAAEPFFGITTGWVCPAGGLFCTLGLVAYYKRKLGYLGDEE